jgi:glutamate-ammonia-ligase adenylyltransferase
MNLERTLAAAPDPILANTAWERVCERSEAREVLERPAVAEIAIPVLGFSPAAADFLVRHPDEAGLFATATPRTRANLDAEVANDVELLGAAAGLRRFRRRALLRIAARDVRGASLDEVVHEITDVADACWAAACALTPGAKVLAVIALGKWGGRELNYSSDVDLLFVHERSTPPDNEAAERAAAALLKLLSQQTADGVALRVDAALRPGGRSGALSRSLEATLDYYDHGSATWERQAMIKARAAVGDQMLGFAFITGVAPFVYPERLEPAAIDDVRRTKVRLEEYIRQRGKELIEVKRGRGGIRDVEFAVQLLQIVHGRRNASLRSPNTLAALQSLADEGYVAEADANALAEAYRFLRQLEHRLQIVRDLQTHDLPSDHHARTTIARSLGLADAQRLQEEYDRTTGLVRSIHERLFYRPLLEAFAGDAQPRQGVDRTATQELLEGLGFARPVRSYEVLARLVDPATRLGKVLGHVVPVMTPAIAMAADPDAALVRLERVAEAVGERPGPADALATDPKAAWRLAHLVGASRFATDALVADPERIRALADGVVHADDAPADMVRVVARYAARELSPAATGAAIAAVGDRVLLEAVDEVAPPLPLAVIGMGKLGAREPSFASDLDVVFVYEGEGADEQRTAVDAAEQIMRAVRDAGWEIDADLRPEGRNGPLARSMAGFLEYWERYAEPWEFQALLRTRAVAGDPALGRRFELSAGDLAYPPDGITIDRVAEIRRMRERIERERVRPAEATKFHFKLGYGSLADVQFAVEMLLLRHGGPQPEIRTTSTLQAIERLAEHRLLEQSVARDLGEAFVFLNDVKCAMEVDRRVHAEAVPPAAEEQTALARRLGYEEYPRQAFMDDYLRITRRCRRAMERLFTEAVS